MQERPSHSLNHEGAARSRIFEVKQFEYTLFKGKVLLGDGSDKKVPPRKISKMWGQPPPAVRMIVGGRDKDDRQKLLPFEKPVPNWDIGELRSPGQPGAAVPTFI
jgi:hypothetical protein